MNDKYLPVVIHHYGSRAVHAFLPEDRASYRTAEPDAPDKRAKKFTAIKYMTGKQYKKNQNEQH